MLKVNEFERDLDRKTTRSRLNDENANIVYTFDGSDVDLLDNLDIVSKYIKHHLEYQKPRLVELNNYYESNNFNLAVSQRRREEHMADNRAAHDYAAYISDFSNGYFLGNPIQVMSNDNSIAEKIEEIHDYNDIDSHNRSLGLDLSIFGRAFEYIVNTSEDKIRLYKSDVKNTFIIYDNSIERNSLIAVRYRKTMSIDEEDNSFIVNIVSKYYTYEYRTSIEDDFKLYENKVPEPHLFDRVTITEFKNNERSRGDFEKVISLIDLYDNAQTDTANYMTDLNDAMLLLKGNVDLNDVKNQKKANVLILEPPLYEDDSGKTTEGTVDGHYIYKQYDVQGTEAYKTRIDNDIHMFTNTPNMKDENFSGTTSGEAMKYKLFGLEQRTKIKEGLFEKALNRRYKLIGTILKSTNEVKSDSDFSALEFTFNRNLPKSIIEELNTYASVGGRISQSTLMSLMSFIKDPELEMEKLKDEEIKESKKQGEVMYDNQIKEETDVE
ncbi:phage portal protein [Mammaliicoccus sciuri]|uniref:phage portal protein n=1 Tax=Mammaliicoccus sciuri TaxID=1296 RepID=UPI0037882CC7